MGKQKNEIVNKLKELFALTQVKFLDCVLQDGSILRTEDEELKQGSAVTLVSSDGSTADAQDGEYTLKDGSKAVIKSGIIDSITPAAPAAPTSDAAETVADAKDAPEAPATDENAGGNLEMITNILQDLVSRIENIEKKLSESSQSTAAMKSQVEKFMKEPVGKPINKSGEGKTGEVKMYSQEWFEQEKNHYSNRNRLNKEIEKLEKNITGKTKINFNADEPEAPKHNVVLDEMLWGEKGKTFAKGLLAGN